MKGMLYSSLLRQRGFILGAGIYTAAATVVGIFIMILGRSFPEIAPPLGVLLMIMPAVSVVIALEGVDRELEKSLKTRFADYTLAAVTPGKFATAELLKNLLLMAYGIALSLAMCVILRVAGEGFFKMIIDEYYLDWKFLGVMPIAGIACSLIEWVIMPLVIKLKSAEKAGMIVGLIVGVVVAISMSGFVNNNVPGFDLGVLVEFPTVLYILAAAVLLYGLFYLILEKRIERGNIC